MELFDVEECKKANDEALKKSSVKRISELEKLIEKYQASYYNGEAEIADAEFVDCMSSACGGRFFINIDFFFLHRAHLLQ